jgi:hypothetical protein
MKLFLDTIIINNYIKKMEENDKEKSFENFIKEICKKYFLEENVLLEYINQDKTKFWNTLIELINKKEEIQMI